jgi:hypothetical protein
MQRKASFHVVDWRQKTQKTPGFPLFHDPVVDTVWERVQVFTSLRCNPPEERTRYPPQDGRRSPAEPSAPACWNLSMLSGGQM